ncbi:hypothetical protein F503_05209 [Ophiostoma piceae UAMH 11346]|uniref:Methyltransferase domain-containing protein n=1 Tax=Ophiostoma piceae (strain UAMH 11346) TaxID=1262450 RepID=S3C9D4_OPHP1|nr:hypothetical protein F503_05209 [Ophiostoma piceae UAMH 11346]
MRPAKDLPYADEFTSADDYVEKLLHYVSTTPIFQTLAGGVHIMDFYTTDPGLFYSVVPADWHSFLLDRAPMELLDFLLRDDIDAAVRTAEASSRVPPPPSLVKYVKDIRRFSLKRGLDNAVSGAKSGPAKTKSVEPLPRKITMGMNVKKIHEVTQFSAYIEQLADSVSNESPATPITHLVDVGSGQNYLGRALASKASQATSGAPGEKRRRRGVVAVESKGHNIAGAKGLDMLTGVMPAPDRPMRNKKLYQQMLSQTEASAKQSEKIRKRLARLKLERNGTEKADDAGEERAKASSEEKEEDEKNEAQKGAKKESKTTPVADMRSRIEIATETYAQKQKANTDTAMESDNLIQYVEGRLENGDLAHVLSQVQPVRECCAPTEAAETAETAGECNFLTVSIHSCGNLSHYGLRALVLNPAVRAVAIVGCCYNLMTERLGPPTYKVPGMGPRPTLQPVNGRVVREEERRDPEGFPMSEYLSNYGDGEDARERGIRFNITARMMACQAPGNWTEAESKAFFTRHYYRAVLQRIFLDREVIKRVTWGAVGVPTDGDSANMPAVGGSAVTPIIVGSLRKACYASLPAYVRGAVEKIASQGNGNGAAAEADNAAVNALVAEKMGPANFTDEALEEYNERYITSDEGRRRRRELSAVWSLMAFSAGVVESTIVADRWKYLREQKVRDCWVENVFEYGQSPRNLVVVGIKEGDSQ